MRHHLLSIKDEQLNFWFINCKKITNSRNSFPNDASLSMDGRQTHACRSHWTPIDQATNQFISLDGRKIELVSPYFPSSWTDSNTDHRPLLA